MAHAFERAHSGAFLISCSIAFSAAGLAGCNDHSSSAQATPNVATAPTEQTPGNGATSPAAPAPLPPPPMALRLIVSDPKGWTVQAVDSAGKTSAVVALSDPKQNTLLRTDGLQYPLLVRANKGAEALFAYAPAPSDATWVLSPASALLARMAAGDADDSATVDLNAVFQSAAPSTRLSFAELQARADAVLVKAGWLAPDPAGHRKASIDMAHGVPAVDTQFHRLLTQLPVQGWKSLNALAFNRPPADMEKDSLVVARYDGQTDDLLTAGLGASGIAASSAPQAMNPMAPTPAELRKGAVYTNYRAVMDTSAGGGYGTLYGPAVGPDGKALPNEGKVAGREVHATFLVPDTDKGTGGKDRLDVMVHIPDAFNDKAPCIVVGTASGSRGIYGAIGVSGEYGLKRGCAVAYSDKGSGALVHELSTDRVQGRDGVLAPKSTVKQPMFESGLSAAQLLTYSTATPNRYAVKHTHSQRNPEAKWGEHALRALEFAYWVLNDQRVKANADGHKLRTDAKSIRPDNTTVIMTGISNGGGAALRAVEADGLMAVQAAAVTEPNVQPKKDERVAVQFGDRPIASPGLPLLDYYVIGNLYMPCAAMEQSLLSDVTIFSTQFDPVRGRERCTQLVAKGLLTGADLQAQARDAIARLRAIGYDPGSDRLYNSHYGLSVMQAISLTYANTYGRYGVADRLCGFSYGNTDVLGLPTMAPPQIPSVYAWGNGIPNMISSGSIFVQAFVSVFMVYDQAANLTGKSIREDLAASPSSGRQDYNLDGALCLLKASQQARVRTGIAEVLADGNLRGRPVVIVHGRDDTVIPVNHASRPYLALNTLAEKGQGKLSYWEVTNAQHFDSFNSFNGYRSHYVSLHFYLEKAIDRALKSYKEGIAMPPSQVIRAIAPGNDAASVTQVNVPIFKETTSSADTISVTQTANKVRVLVPQ